MEFFYSIVERYFTSQLLTGTLVNKSLERIARRYERVDVNAVPMRLA